MNRADVKARLSKCENLVELHREASILKKEGAHPNTVNKVVTECRKALLKVTASIKRVERINIEIKEPEKIGFLGMQVRKIDDPVIYYDGDSTIIL